MNNNDKVTWVNNLILVLVLLSITNVKNVGYILSLCLHDLKIFASCTLLKHFIANILNFASILYLKITPQN